MIIKFKLLLLSLFLPLALSAQDIKIEGTVTSAGDGETLPGVSVKLVGTAIGAITDIDGHYVLTLTSPGKVSFSYLGCKTQTKDVRHSDEINIVLEDDANMLEEVVAIGYCSLKKSDLTGSVTVVNAADLKKTPAANLDEALQGRAAGVSVNASSGQPGASAEVRIRGIGTVNDAAPIYVVDGDTNGRFLRHKRNGNGIGKRTGTRHERERIRNNHNKR